VIRLIFSFIFIYPFGFHFQKVSALGHSGNILLNKLVGSTVILVNSFDKKGGSIAELEAQLEMYREHLV